LGDPDFSIMVTTFFWVWCSC